jgi:ERCC4-type nuclease/TusA-related sulfurtransferase
MENNMSDIVSSDVVSSDNVSVDTASDNTISLVVDDREGSVTAFIDETITVPIVIQRITVGDYHIKRGSNICAVVERKSLKDYAASIIDGRTTNLTKMLEARETTGAKLIYIIEGPAWPADTTKFGSIPYKSVKNSISRLVVLHDVHIIYTKNPRHTLQELVHLCEIYQDAPISGGSAEPLASIRKSPEQIMHTSISKAWATIPRISIYTGEVLAKHYTLLDLLKGIDVTGFRLPSGVSISSAAVENLKHPDRIKILSNCPGLSEKTATFICNTYNLDSDLEEMKKWKKTTKTKLGTQAERLHYFLNKKY